jgi:L-ascorbate metabolism protein UlaG (beta-lactamase superfamily)
LFWTVTMDASQGVDFLQRIRPHLAVPVHYDDYRVFRSPLSEFLSAMKRDLSGQLLKAPARRETVLSASDDCCLHRGAGSGEL